uniref:Uncharacterized protein n=1 Tax=Anguilla anguilla TaxID=7936 RepID=A0A0E9T631_ANGAN
MVRLENTGPGGSRELRRCWVALLWDASCVVSVGRDGLCCLWYRDLASFWCRCFLVTWHFVR